MSHMLYEQITDALVHDGYIVIPHAMYPAFSNKLLNLAKKDKNLEEQKSQEHKTLPLTPPDEGTKFAGLMKTMECKASF